MKKARSNKPPLAAGTRTSSKASKQPAPAAELAAPTPELPPAVLAQIFSQLHAEDVGYAASVCSSWRGAASLEPVAWTLAMTNLDPFCALGGADGAAALFRAAAGCWLRAASVLTYGMRMRRGEKTPCQCASPDCAANASVLCCCVSSDGMSGVKRYCSKHCSGSEACVKLKGGPLYNPWVFNPKRLATVEGKYGGTLVSDDGPNDLQDLIAKSKNCKTVSMQGCFGGPHNISKQNVVDVATSLVMLENVSCCFSFGLEHHSGCCCGKCTEYSCLSPAITVRNGAHLIAHNCTFASANGAAVMLKEGSKTTLHGCTVVSHGLHVGNVLQLAGHNTFVNEAIKHPEEDPHYPCIRQHMHECQCEPVLLCGCENEGECGCEYECGDDYIGDDGQWYQSCTCEWDESCRGDCLTCSSCILEWDSRITEGPVAVEEYANTAVQPWRADWPCHAGHALSRRKQAAGQ
ncbi:hypothetical protein FOA52_001906 [Chlamydomonas sp. UWO 241]|nr:hypothetical protein FOA52_001906 [Chlamydomonas sp. UWO 241]